jgi:hypothetical protein
MEFLTAKEIAELLKVSEWFVYQNREMFAGIKIGKIIRFDKQTTMEVLYERIRASKEVALGILEGQKTLPKQMLQNQRRSGKVRKNGQRENGADEFRFQKALQRQIEGTEGLPDGKVSQRKRQAP